MPGFSMEILNVVFPYSLVMAIVGLMESLMTLLLVDELTNTKTSTRQECLGQVMILTTLFFHSLSPSLLSSCHHTNASTN